MNKKTLTSITLSLILVFEINTHGISQSKGKDFEGLIHYQYTYVSDKLNQDSLNQGKDNEGIYFWKKGSYKGSLTGGDGNLFIYNSWDNRCYYSNNSNLQGYFYCMDYRQSTDTLLSVEIINTNEKILGEVCDLLIIKTPQYTSKYYFSKRYRVDPSYYKEHKAYLWDILMEKTNGGAILKSITEYKDYKFEATATKIELKELDDKEFKVDGLKIISECN